MLYAQGSAVPARAGGLARTFLGLRAGFALLLAFSGVPALAQTGTSPLAAPPNGVREGESSWHALVGATVHVAPGQTLEAATVVVRDGRIVSVRAGSDTDGDGEPDAPAAPAGARVWDCDGLHIYAGFIDPFVEVDAPVEPAGSPGLHWSSLIVPQRDATRGPGVPGDVASSLRGLGFTAAGVSPRGGILRGTAGVVSLGAAPSDSSRDRVPVYASDVYMAAGFDRVGWGGDESYPTSRLGSIALMRQSFIDAAWQVEAREAGATVAPNCLDELTAHADIPLAFDSGSELETVRAIYLAEEFGREGVWIGSGLEVRMLAGVVEAGWPLVLPLNFPETPDVSSVGRADSVSLTELMTWEQVPTGPRRFDAAGLDVSLTTHRLRRRGDFDDNLRKAIEHGLAPERALAMLTTNPAELLGVGDMLGSVEVGKVASLIVADGDIFDEDTEIRDVWVDGVRYEINAGAEPTLDGGWDLLAIDGGERIEGSLSFESGRRVAATIGEVTVRGRNARLSGEMVSFVIDTGGERAMPGEEGEAVASAVLVGPDRMVGQAMLPSGRVLQFSATRRGPDADPSGVWSVEFPGTPAPPIRLTIRNNRVEYEGEMAESVAVRDFKVEGNVMTYTVRPRESGRAEGESDPRTPEGDEAAAGDESAGEAGDPPGTVHIRAEITGDSMAGTATTGDGEEIAFTGTRTPLPPQEEEADEAPAVPETFGYPFGPYARTEMPAQETLVIRNATIWTSADAGIIENGAMLVSGGSILYVGDAAGLDDLLARVHLMAPIREIDAGGRHITPGIIDCHSHTGLTDINEGGQSCTAEVRISDGADPTDISWYRQLAGGVTAVNSLHGSANAIGGQNQVQRIRWGSVMPWDFFFEGAPLGIKFALGENPKRGNSYGPNAGNRYPQTRMGVEAVIRDRFTAAQQYAAAMERYEREGGVPPRRDLELEAMAEILAGDRLVHCHSYRADEILMLCQIAHQFGFVIGTFQHALEVYKVATEVREAAIGASAFSDWWAYKVEVQDAIPSAGAIMHEVGIVVSFNSDSDELARRLNMEAAKAVRYGGVDPAEALRFVTLNPAIQLGIADRVGSLEAGKDADFVIWSGDPLSSLTRCEATYVEGRCQFSLEEDAQMREANASERRRIIQRILAMSRPEERGGARGGDGAGRAGPGGGRPGRPGVLGLAEIAARDAISNHHLDLIRQGMDPDAPVCGDCGMTLQELMNR
ncbi:MAG: amidohydrolase family protein [Phycisphaerales bacterium]